MELSVDYIIYSRNALSYFKWKVIFEMVCLILFSMFLFSSHCQCQIYSTEMIGSFLYVHMYIMPIYLCMTFIICF